jgi:hypothetical protein
MSDRVDRWRRLVASLKASGLSRAEFCRRRRLNYHTMTYWLKRLGGSDGAEDNNARASFVEVSLPAVVASATYEVVLGSGRVIRLGAAFDDEAVARLVRMLESC